MALYKVGSVPSSLSWDDNGILFPQPGTGIVRISPNGGKPEVVVALSTRDGVAHGPQMLPDGDTMLFTLADADGTANIDRWSTARIVVQSLKTGRRQTLIELGTDARYVPSGHIVYAVGGTLFARSFDLKKLAITGGPVPVVDGVRRVMAALDNGSAHFGFSNTGSLVYLPGPSAVGVQSLNLFDRSGQAEVLKLPPGPYGFPRVSPDGKRVAFESNDGKEAFVAITPSPGPARPHGSRMAAITDIQSGPPTANMWPSNRIATAIRQCSGNRLTAALQSVSLDPVREHRMCPSPGVPSRMSCSSARRIDQRQRFGRYPCVIASRACSETSIRHCFRRMQCFHPTVAGWPIRPAWARFSTHLALVYGYAVLLPIEEQPRSIAWSEIRWATTGFSS